MTSKLKRHLMIASLVTLLPVPAAFFLSTPAGMQAHIRSFAWASVALLLSLWLCAWLTLRDPGNKGRNEKPLALMLWVIPITSILCSVYVWAAAMGYELGTTGFLIPMGLLFSAIDRLPEREKEIVFMRYGLDGRKELTQKEVAQKMGISQSYISRLEKRIMLRLRKELLRQTNCA